MAQHGVVPTASDAAPALTVARRRAGVPPKPFALRAVLLGVVVVAVIAAVVVVVTLRLVNQDPEPHDENWWLVGELVVGFAYLAAGAVLTGPREHRARGAALLAVGFAALVAAVASQYASYARTEASGPAWPWLASLAPWARAVAVALLAGIVLLAVLPTRRRAQPWVRSLLLVAAVCVGLLVLDGITDRWPAWSEATNPLAPTSAGWADAIAAAGQLARVGIVGAAVVAVVLLAHRWREQRRSSDDPLPAWLLVGAVAGALAAVPALWGGVAHALPASEVVAPLLLMATVPLLVVGAVVEMVRGAPSDQDVTSHRLLEWTLLAAGIVLVYTGAVAGLGRMVGGTGPTWFLVAATGVIAILLEPARRRVRGHADRLVYGSRDNALSLVRQVLGHVSAAADDEDLLPALAASLGQEMHLDLVVIDVAGPDGWERSATYGSDPAVHDLTRQRQLPLEYHGETVGRLTVGWSEAASLRARDAATLKELAAPLALAVSWVRLAADLRRSSLAAVSAREEERRRLRRDLHDGLGPTLTGISLGLRTAVRQLEREGHAADAPVALLQRLSEEVDGAVGEVRRIVRGLRPSVLDQLGLVGALAEFTRSFEDASVELHVSLPGEEPALPAAVEVAVYRTVTEALTNVIRHADAAECWVTVAVAGSVDIDVADDGAGVERGTTPGVGLTAMRERAAELGGSVTVSPRLPHGTHVYVRLPAVLP